MEAFENQQKSVSSEEYIVTSIDTVLKEGMQLMEEYAPEVSYRSITKYKVDDFTLNNFREELDQYFNQYQIQRPGQNGGLLQKIFRFGS
jgi:hypothetical protein